MRAFDTVVMDYVSVVSLTSGPNNSRQGKEQRLIFKLGTLAPKGLNKCFHSLQLYSVALLFISFSIQFHSPPLILVLLCGAITFILQFCAAFTAEVYIVHAYPISIAKTIFRKLR